jgi:hypothetical protein
LVPQKGSLPTLDGGTGMSIVIVYLLFPQINQPVFPSQGGLTVWNEDFLEMTVP